MNSQKTNGQTGQVNSHINEKELARLREWDFVPPGAYDIIKPVNIKRENRTHV